jgi:hypothetical protein
MPDRKNRVRLPVLVTMTSLCTAFVAGCGGGGGGAPVAAQRTTPSGQTNQLGQGDPSAQTAPPAANSTGSVTLSWLPPTEKIDGTPLTNLAGYRIYWGKKRGHYTNSVTVDNPGLMSHVIEYLTPARWYFVVVALTTEGLEGERSDVLTQTVH